LAETFEYYLLGETIGTDRLITRITNPDNLGQFSLAEILCKYIASLTCD